MEQGLEADDDDIENFIHFARDRILGEQDRLNVT